MNDLGLMRYFLGIEFIQLDLGIFVCQMKYVMDVLKRFEMMNSKPTPTPIVSRTKLNKEDKGSNADPNLFKILVGNLMYLTTTRPYIMYASNSIPRFMESPKDSHWQVGKIILISIIGMT